MTTDPFEKMEIWFVAGSQHLYGPEVLEKVAQHAAEIAAALDTCETIPVRVFPRPVMVSSEGVTDLCLRANADPRCIGLVTWCHTFSPSKMWINGLKQLRKPICHFHTQYNRDLPWDSIDMDFMNLNQAAHGDREHGFLMSRLRISRKVVVGHWSDSRTRKRIGDWTRAAAAWHDWQGARFVRFGDNMREVAVTEGDKVSAQFQLGFSVNTHGVGDLVKHVRAVADGEVDALCRVYHGSYATAAGLQPGGARHEAVREAARIELGLRSFLENGGFKGFTTTFEDLHGLAQLPGLAPQRLMAEGYGFAGEGDWKTAALVRAMKVMAHGLPGGASFMEDYTYHMERGGELVLGAHMLEICPSIAAGKPSLEVHPLGIGGKADPARLVFSAAAGPAVNVSLMDMGNRFRFLINEVDVLEEPRRMPRLPVARAVWKCRPDFETAALCWIHAGGAHHTAFSRAVTTEMIEDFATMAGIELAIIDRGTNPRTFLQNLGNNEVLYALKGGWCI